MPALSMKRMLLLSVVGRAIQEIDADPKRGLRRMVDLGQELVHGKQEIFSFLQQMLQKQNSPCYALLERMVHEVAHKSIQHFSVALGWDSWAEGGRLLRQSAEQQDWAKSLTITEADTPSALREQVQRYIAKGVRTFFVKVNSKKTLATALQLTSEQTATLLLVPPFLIDHQTAARIALCHTVCTALCDAPERARAQEILRQAKCLYGVYHICSAEETADSVRAWLCKQSGPYFAIVQEQGSREAQAIAREIAKLRQNPTVPMIPIAAKADFDQIQAQLMRKG
ncbi:MAG: hypothetical protein Q4A63_07925 [Butyricicoccus pullicaecorum]|nr:hypothetical protein [Butyricicoccus pullicaecorum]MDO4669732.1 hypothetical protein [Butyricicoccus pullicaecorum]